MKQTFQTHQIIIGGNQDSKYVNKIKHINSGLNGFDQKIKKSSISQGQPIWASFNVKFLDLSWEDTK